MASSSTAIRQITGTVVSSGLMSKTVKVRIAQQVWDNHIRKYFRQPTTVLVHDPRSSLLSGDVVRLSAGWRVSKNVRHVVTEIIAPFGKRVEERPAVMTREEREAERERWREERRAMKARKEEEGEVVVEQVVVGRGEKKGAEDGKKGVREGAERKVKTRSRRERVKTRVGG